MSNKMRINVFRRHLRQLYQGSYHYVHHTYSTSNEQKETCIQTQKIQILLSITYTSINIE